MRYVWVPAVMLTAALAGCSTQPRDTRAAYEPITDVTGAATPMVQISPSAGDVVSVLQSRADGVITQRMVLKGDAKTSGENQIVVKIDQGDRRTTGVDGPVPKPTESLIQGELDESFPNVDMRMSTTWNRNSFGPFGYAIGHPSTAVTCIYAWQWQGARVLPLVGSPGDVASSTSLPAWPTSVRVRLCKSGVGEAEIVAMLRDMIVYAPGSSEPYQDPAYKVGGQGAKDALSAAGVPGGMFLAPRSASADAAEPDEPAPRHHHRKHARLHAGRHKHRHEVATRYQEDDAPSALGAPIVDVPLPTGAAAKSPASAAGNPLLAPLQAAAPPPVAPRAATSAGDMPLPPAAAPRAAAPAASQPALGSVPLPN